MLLERAPSLEPLPANYAPRTGDRLVILVNRPADPEPPSVTIENKVNGEVLLAATGGIPRVLARVKQPLKGIGRYPGTERAGQGAVLGWSPTLALVSTSGVSRRLDPDNQPVEERGGFVIQPAEPALRGVTHPASQLLLESVADPGAKADPLDAKLAVSPFFGLPVPLTSGDPLDPKPTRVEVKIDGGDWEAFPDLRGTINEENMLKALQEALGGDRTVKTGITHLRVVYGSATPVSAQRRARLASTPRAGNSVQRGKVTITANVMGEGISYVSFFLNGTLVRITNLPPYGWEWDTLRVPNGEHLLEIRGSDGKGAILSSIVTKVLVDN